MCVIFLAYGQHADHPLVLIANRDEFYSRPTAPAGYWEDFPAIYGGRDLQNGGTWLGVTEGGRFAAVTNYRDPLAPTGSRSRGDLVAEFLKSGYSPKIYLEQIENEAGEYSGFNLIVGRIGKISEIFYYSSRGGAPIELGPGFYALSNHLLDTPWPKVAKGKAAFTNLFAKGDPKTSNFFKLLADESLAADADLPSTGVAYDVEKAISAIFIKTPGYGTRCSTVLKFDYKFRWAFEEKVFV
ncbi:MAG: NRDE family protein [Pyrinomonadaceae bacterium]